MIIIQLEFDKSETGLAGFPYGKAIFDSQVKDKIDYSESVKIVFPSQIQKVASSFVQGFFADIIENIGYKNMKDRIEIESNSETLTDSIWKRVF